MRHLARARNICLGITAISGASILTGILLPATALGVNYNIGFIVGGSAVGLYTLLVGLKLVYNTKAYNKLLAGEGLKAQWMVPPDLWREFVAYHAQLAPMNPTHANLLRLTPDPPVEGVEVILGERAVIVDGDYQSLPTYTNDSRFEAVELHSGPPMFINMHITSVHATRTGTRRTYHAIRFPVAPEAARNAAETVDWYIRQANELAIRSRSLAQRFPGPIRNISIMIAILAAAAATAGFYCRNQPQMLDQNTAVILAVAGVLIGPAAMIVAAVSHRYLKKQQKTAKQ